MGELEGFRLPPINNSLVDEKRVFRSQTETARTVNFRSTPAFLPQNALMNPSVLIVDDEPDILSSMARILRRSGYKVDTAMSLAEAANREHWSDYFAVLLDRKLPDGMSEEFVPKLNQLAPQAAIIVITAYADLESSLACLRNGVEDYLLKPVDPEAVLHRLKRIQQMREVEQRAHQAERLSDIGAMLTAIAHESRNALQRMQAGIEMLSLDLPEHSETRADLIRIDRAREDLERLFDELRNYAAPINLRQEAQDLASTWRQAWLNLETQRADRDVELLESDAAADLPCAIDAFRIEQVFRNLMENSLAACTDPVRIRIRSRPSDLDGVPAVRISVRDNGPGLTKEQQSHLFDPFFTTKAEGTGLGMAISARIIDAHRGTLQLGDCSNRGAEFVITLPRIQTSTGTPAFSDRGA
jgi:signal transduction histidine kinase